jgi:U3 small nucleolar RNA-associated protein 20
VIDTLLALEASSVNLANERHILSLISRIEVLARCGRLPVAFTEAAASHMLGVFHVKFAPIWPAATSALVALAESSIDLLWPSLYATMIETMEPPSTFNVVPRQGLAQLENGVLLNPRSFFENCLKWELSIACDASLFQADLAEAQNEGRVSRHQTTDHSTRFELVWRVLEEADCIILKKSRLIVPVFLDFLMNQYFVFFEDDPTAREISLDLSGMELRQR